MKKMKAQRHAGNIKKAEAAANLKMAKAYARRKKAEAAERRKKAEANARHKVNEKWDKVKDSAKYRRAVARDFCHTVTGKIEEELLDGILLNLKNTGKPANSQRRILRRIVEKRQAQANHKKNGRTCDLTSKHISIECTATSLRTIRQKMSCRA